MNYVEQVNDMVDTYARAQQHVWNDWFDAMQSLQARSISMDVWQQPIEVWTEWSKRMLETQTKELSDIQTAWIRQSQQIAESNAETGRQMMERWIEAAGRFEGIELFQVWNRPWDETWNGTWQEAINVWQESMGKVFQIQAEALKQVEKPSAASKQTSSKAKKEPGKPGAAQAA